MATFKHDYKIDSGMITISAIGGASDEKKHLKLGWALALTYSINPSNPFNPYNQDYIKWRFYNIIQVPFLAASNKAFLALFSCPYPMDILTKFPLAIENPKVAPIYSTSGVGSTPGNKTNKIGVILLVSA